MRLLLCAFLVKARPSSSSCPCYIWPCAYSYTYMMADWRPKLHADSIEPVINALATICVCEVDDVIAIALESGVDNGDKIDDTSYWLLSLKLCSS